MGKQEKPGAAKALRHAMRRRARYSPLTIRYSPPIHHSPLTTRYSPPLATRYSPLATRYSPLAT